MEQKLVQRCETEVDGDACKASYVAMSLQGWSYNQGLTRRAELEPAAAYSAGTK